MNVLYAEMLRRADPGQVAGLSRFFKTGPGQYGYGDQFLGRYQHCSVVGGYVRNDSSQLFCQLPATVEIRFRRHTPGTDNEGGDEHKPRRRVLLPATIEQLPVHGFPTFPFHPHLNHEKTPATSPATYTHKNLNVQPPEAAHIDFKIHYSETGRIDIP